MALEPNRSVLTGGRALLASCSPPAWRSSVLVAQSFQGRGLGTPALDGLLEGASFGPQVDIDEGLQNSGRDKEDEAEDRSQ